MFAYTIDMYIYLRFYILKYTAILTNYFCFVISVQVLSCNTERSLIVWGPSEVNAYIYSRAFTWTESFLISKWQSPELTSDILPTEYNTSYVAAVPNHLDVCLSVKNGVTVVHLKHLNDY